MNSLPWSIAEDTRLWRYALSVLSVLAIWPCLAQAGELVSEDNDMLLFLVVLVFSALYLGRGPTRAATFTSLLILNLGHVHPGFRPGFHKFQYVISFAIFLVVGDQIARLADSVRRAAWRAQELYLFTQESSRLSSPEAVLGLFREHARLFCGVDVEVRSASGGGSPLETPRGVYGWIHPVVQGNLLYESLRTQTALALERIAQDEKTRQSSVLEATQKLQSTLINSISHDLQTPLSSIRGSVDTLIACEVAEVDRRVLLELASDQIRRLEKLVLNILNLSKLEGGGLRLSLRLISLEEVIRGTVATFPTKIRARIHWEVTDEVPDLQADFALLTQLLANLLDNALKFSKGPVEIRLEVGEHLRLAVSDTGFGILPEEREQIFERFYRGNTPYQVPGSGLGLNICRSIAELHHGRIWVESAVCGGSRFVVELPWEQDLQNG